MEPATALLVGGGINAASSLAGGIINNMFSKPDDTWERNYEAQKEFAQNSIQWRVQDAQKAGIHPLYAFGQMPGYTPSSSFETNSMGESIAQAGNAMGRAMGQIGLLNAELQNKSLQKDIEKKDVEITKDKAELLSSMSNLVGGIPGQKSDTIPAITKQADNTLFLASDGHMRNLPDQLESEIASLPADLAKIWDSQYSRGTHEKLPEIPGKRKVIMLSPLGYSSKYVDKNSDLSFSDKFFNVVDRGLQFFLNTDFKDGLRKTFLPTEKERKERLKLDGY